MACELEDFDAQSCETPLAGVQFIYYTSVADVLSIGAATNHTVATIVNATGKNFRIFPASKRTMNYKETKDSTDPDSATLLSMVTGYVKNITALNQKAIDALQGELILLVGLNSGKTMIVGDLLNGARFEKSDSDSGTNQSGQKNGYTISFKKEGGTHTDYVFSGDAQALLLPGA